MSIQVTPIPRLTVLAAPAFTLGTANAAGSAVTAVASDATLLAFDTTLPDAITFGQSGAVGSSTTAARRSHAHAMASDPANLVLIGTAVASTSSTLTVTGLDDTYDTYMILISDIKMSQQSEIGLRVGAGSIDSGSSDYDWFLQGQSPAGGTSFNAYVDTSDSNIRISNGTGADTGDGFAGTFWLGRPGGGTGTMQPAIQGMGVKADDDLGYTTSGIVFGQRDALIAVDRIQIYPHGGTFLSGRLNVLGVAHG